MGDPEVGRKEFGILAPTNAAVWNLRVRICPEVSSFGRFNRMLGEWWRMKSRGDSFSKATRDAWNTFYGVGSDQVVESELITNAVPRTADPPAR